MCLFSLPTLAVDDDQYKKLDVLLKQAPADVVALVTRKLDCYHFGGEEPYDDARRAEILRNVTRLKCAAVDADETSLRKKYAQVPPALKTLDAARDVTP